MTTPDSTNHGVFCIDIETDPNLSLSVGCVTTMPGDRFLITNAQSPRLNGVYTLTGINSTPTVMIQPDGNVQISPDTTLTEASELFWMSVSGTAAQMRQQIEELTAENEKLKTQLDLTQSRDFINEYVASFEQCGGYFSDVVHAESTALVPSDDNEYSPDTDYMHQYKSQRYKSEYELGIQPCTSYSYSPKIQSEVTATSKSVLDSLLVTFDELAKQEDDLWHSYALSYLQSLTTNEKLEPKHQNALRRRLKQDIDVGVYYCPYIPKAFLTTEESDNNTAYERAMKGI